MLKELSASDSRLNNINYLNIDPVKQIQFNHPFYANRTSYPTGEHLIQKQCPNLPTPTHNQFTFTDLITGSRDNTENLINFYLPTSIGSFVIHLIESISGLIEDLLTIDRNFTLEQILNILMVQNRLFYVGIICIGLYCLRYLANSLFGQH